MDGKEIILKFDHKGNIKTIGFSLQEFPTVNHVKELFYSTHLVHHIPKDEIIYILLTVTEIFDSNEPPNYLMVTREIPPNCPTLNFSLYLQHSTAIH